MYTITIQMREGFGDDYSFDADTLQDAIATARYESKWEGTMIARVVNSEGEIVFDRYGEFFA